GLCAGGDIKAVYNDIVAGSDENAKFWNREYKMNFAISEFPKPYVVIMNGITMGGGVGISGHGSHRIATESTKVGMPETGIGLFPDVGGTHLLANSPGELGTHLALTGQPVGAGAAIALGLADRFVADAQIPDLIANLTAGQDLDTVLDRYAAEAPANELADAADWSDECYGGDSAEDIVAALAAHESPDAQAAAEVVQRKAPTAVNGTLAADESADARAAAEVSRSKASTAVKGTLAALRNAAGMPLAEVLEQDYRVAVALTERPDLKEGIRAQVIDKDRNPQWSPATLAEVSDETVETILTTDHEEKVFS